MRDKQLSDLALLLLRLCFGGVMMFSHGLGKAKKVFAGDFSFADPLGIGEGPSLILASSAEFLFAGLLALGLFTRISALQLMFTMAVAAFVVHGADPFGKKEMALLYLCAYTALFLMGPGRYSLQHLLPARMRGKGRVARFLLG